MHAQAGAGERLGRSQGGQRRKRKEKGLKRGSTGFIKSLFGPVSILRTFWVKGHFVTNMGGTTSILRTFLGETSEKKHSVESE